MDEVISLERFARVARELVCASADDDADILCFRKVAQHDPELDGSRDEARTLASPFPEHEMLFGPAMK